MEATEEDRKYERLEPAVANGVIIFATIGVLLLFLPLTPLCLFHYPFRLLTIFNEQQSTCRSFYQLQHGTRRGPSFFSSSLLPSIVTYIWPVIAALIRLAGQSSIMAKQKNNLTFVTLQLN